jgi:hypothetical protein
MRRRAPRLRATSLKRRERTRTPTVWTTTGVGGVACLLRVSAQARLVREALARAADGAPCHQAGLHQEVRRVLGVRRVCPAGAAAAPAPSGRSAS